MEREYSQKVALVTGGARGIGNAIARLLAERGYRVTIADRQAAAQSELEFIRCDVAREADVRSCIAQVLRRHGRLDALVNNAGLADPESGPLEALSLAEWNRRLAVNLTACS